MKSSIPTLSLLARKKGYPKRKRCGNKPVKRTLILRVVHANPLCASAQDETCNLYHNLGRPIIIKKKLSRTTLDSGGKFGRQGLGLGLSYMEDSIQVWCVSHRIEGYQETLTMVRHAQDNTPESYSTWITICCWGA